MNKIDKKPVGAGSLAYERKKTHWSTNDKYIEVCLNCTAKKCRGDCKKVHERSEK